MQSTRPLVILKTGDTYPGLREAHGDFEHWIADGLDAAELPLLVLDPRRGDALPAPGGQNDAALREGVRATPEAAMLLQRFARIVGASC